MSQETEIINRVAQSPLVTIDLEDYFTHGERVTLDLKEWLFQGLILREKEFRQAVKEHDWGQYEGTHVAIICTADAIVPVWAYMLLVTKLEPVAETVVYGSLIDLENALFQKSLDTLNIQDYQDKKVVIKGCGSLPIPEFAYVEITRRLRPVVSSLMYGEPCSTVPLYKASKK